MSNSRCPLPLVFDPDLVTLSFERVLIFILHNQRKSKEQRRFDVVDGKL